MIIVSQAVSLTQLMRLRFVLISGELAHHVKIGGVI